MKRQHYAIALVLVSFFVLGLLRLNDLSVYSDSTRYVIWGTSFSQGKGFVDDTQPLPEYYVVNAPLYSVVLSPALLLFPFSLTAAKIVTLLFGCVALWLFYQWAKKQSTERFALLLTIILAWLPFTVVLATEALSETLFLTTLFLLLLFAEKYFAGTLSLKEKIFALILLALLPLIREIGFVFLFAAALVLFSENRKYDSLTVLLASFVLWGLWYLRNTTVGIPSESQAPNTLFFFQRFVTPEGTPLILELWQRFLINGGQYLHQLTGFAFYAFPTNLVLEPSGLFLALTSLRESLAWILLLLFVSLLLLGLWKDWKTATGKIRVLFLLFYAGVLLLYPMLDTRFVFPVIPFLLWNIAGGVRVLADIVRQPKVAGAGVGVIAVLLIVPNIVAIAEIEKSNFRYKQGPELANVQSSSYESIAYYTTPWQRIGEWFKKNVPQGTVVATPAKEMSLFAPHLKFLEINRGVPTPMYEAFLRKHQAEYLIAPFVVDNITDYYIQMHEGKRLQYELLAQFSRVGIFRIHYIYREPKPFLPPQTPEGKLDSLYTTFRAFLHSENYSEAQQTLEQFSQLYPRSAESQFQKLLLHTLMANDSAATQDLKVLYSLPLSTPYIPTAFAFVSIAETYKKALQKYSENLLQSEELFHISRFYWNMGYPTQAARIMNEALHADSTNFIGLLWALHYSIEANKPQRSFLKQLDSLEYSNVLVQGFHRILRLRDSLAHAQTSGEKAKLYRTLADIYDAIGLPDEALDNAEKSISFEPLNPDRWLALASLYEKQKALFGAYVLYKKVLTLEPRHPEAQLALYKLRQSLNFLQ